MHTRRRLPDSPAADRAGHYNSAQTTGAGARHGLILGALPGLDYGREDESLAHYVPLNLGELVCYMKALRLTLSISFFMYSTESSSDMPRMSWLNPTASFNISATSFTQKDMLI